MPLGTSTAGVLPVGVPGVALRRPSPGCPSASRAGRRWTADQVFQRGGIAFAHDVLQRIERMAEALRLLEHFFAVGHQDVAPHLGSPGGDAGEVAKARAGQRQEVAPGRLVDDALK
jgi:hypothetical protein